MATLLIFVAANGEVLMSVIMTKGTSSQDGSKIKATFAVEEAIFGHNTISKRRYPLYFAATETGFINKELFDNVIANFCELWTTQHPGLNAWLFGEQLGAHIDESIVARSMQQHVFMWFFAANTSHFLQPLNSTPFAVLKKKLKELCTDSLSEALFTKEHKKSLLSSIVFEAI